LIFFEVGCECFLWFCLKLGRLARRYDYRPSLCYEVSDGHSDPADRGRLKGGERSRRGCCRGRPAEKPGCGTEVQSRAAAGLLARPVGSVSGHRTGQRRFRRIEESDLDGQGVSPKHPGGSPLLRHGTHAIFPPRYTTSRETQGGCWVHAPVRPPRRHHRRSGGTGRPRRVI